MALTKIKLGKYIKLFSQQCNISHLSKEEVSGINRDKEFFEPSTQVGYDTSNYKIVPPNYFACNLMHVGRDVVLPIAYNHSLKNKIVSPAYFVFNFIDNKEILSDYFFLFLKSSERDRYFWFQTDGSVRDGMSWDDFIKVELDIPPIEVQQKYVDIYNAMLENQKNYERGLEDLKLVCDGYIEDLRRKYPCEAIGKHLQLSDTRNYYGLSLENVRGISTNKAFTETKADMTGVELNSYKIVAPNFFAYVPDTSRRGNKISLALNTSNEIYLVSSISTVFSTDKDSLLPKYLMLFLTRAEFDRYARFNSWGSARETFDWDEMHNISIPIPNIETQKAIAEIFEVYNMRKEINEKLKAQIKDICPILIRGSLEESIYDE